MALPTNRIHADLRQFRRVSIMTIRAGHALVIHLALDKRAPLVVFLENLAVGIIDALFEQAGHIAIEERLSWLVVAGDGMAARMARSAGVDLVARARLTFPVHGTGVGLRSGPRSAGSLQIHC